MSMFQVEMFCDCLRPRSREQHASLAQATAPSSQRVIKGLPASDELEVTCIAPANDNIACGDANGALIAYDYTSAEIKKRWEGHSKSITKVCKRDSSAGDGQLLTSSRDLSVKLWSVAGGDSCLQDFTGHHDLVVSAAAFQPGNGQLMCSGSRDNSIALWDLETGEVMRSSKIARNLVTDICWKGELLAQTSEDKTLRLWDFLSLEVAQTFALMQQILTSCDINGHQVATTSGGFNGTGCEVTLWDSRQGPAPLHVFKGHTEKVHKCCYVSSYDGGTSYLASISADQTIRLWNCTTLTQESVYNIACPVTSLTLLDQDSQCFRFGVASPDSGVQIVELDKATCRHWDIYF
ncbi:WD repeat-containing protein 31-like [Watersipora subatra]|uniref:WD repeat-containing protein 31-like n=1 Tax=Watersipora subatra TaxID=2589382 RepID=UPI00355B10E3